MPPHVEYSLSEDGKGLFEIFEEIAKWGMDLKNKRSSEPVDC
ncbi:winged helix-turn-helix transcriptional regulator [Ruminiclostridium hungatei]